ncbi:DUF6161 domain-containing protein [Aquirufa sp. TARAVU-A1A]
MNTKEFRKRISESKLPDWFNTVSVTINYPMIDFEIELVGLSSIHDFFSKQVEGWQATSSLPGEFQQSLIHFRQLIQLIEQFLEKCINLEDENSISTQWNNTRTQICSQNNYFTIDAQKSKFLIGLHSNNPEYYFGAYSYIIGEFKSSNKNDFIGSLLAYEFDSKGTSELGKRVDSERKSIKQLRNDFQKQINQTETQLTEHLTKSSKDYKDYVTSIDKFKEEKEEIFNSWYENSQNDFNLFDTESKTKIAELEKTYEEKLRLEKPAEYWSKRANLLKKEGWKAIHWLIGLVVFACFTLYLLLWLTPEGMLLSFIKGEAQAIKWSIIYVTFISFLAFGIRALNKVAFSSFHLARDSEEREQLTYVYLSLKKDSAIEEKDRILILQSLFSRAETGLLKDESGPTMPSDWANKIPFNK